MKYNVNSWLIICILLLSLVVRVVGLGGNPTILNRDEAAIGYNALLLAQTGTDEWGKTWPLTLQSFGDYKLIGYPALVSVLFKFFEPSDFLVRVPSAVAGVGTLFVLYLLLSRFTNNKRPPIFFLGLLACTPLFFFYSRIAFEANVALFLFLLFIFWIFRPVDTKTIYYDILAGLLITVAIVTYNTPLLLLPFIIFLLPFIRGLNNSKQWLLITVYLVCISSFFFLTFHTLTEQKQGITIFSDVTTHYNYIQYRNSLSGIEQKFLGNKYYYYFSLILPRFIKSFGPEFLVFRGGSHPWHQLPEWSHLFITQYIFVVVSIFYLFSTLFIKYKRLTILKILKLKNRPLLSYETGRIICLLYLMITSLAPSVITVDSPHATRSLFFISMLLLIVGYWLSQLNFALRLNQVLLGTFFVATLMLGYSYSKNYLYIYPTEQMELLRSDYKRILHELNALDESNRIDVVDPSGYQYMLTAWYLQIPPTEFYNTVQMDGPDPIGFYYGSKVGRFTFIRDRRERSQDSNRVVEWNKDTYTWEIK